MACLASCVLVDEAMAKVGGLDEMVLHMWGVNVAAAVFTPFHKEVATPPWEPIEDDRLWSAMLVRLQRFIMQCESPRVEAMTLDTHLRA